MKNIVRSSLVIVSAFSLFLVAPLASAATDKTTSQPTAADKLEMRNKRVAAYKLKHTIKLADKEQTRLKGVCKASQNKVASFATRATKTSQVRNKVYVQVDTKLKELVPKLKLANVDTTDLDKDITELQVLTKAYGASFVTLQTDLQDLSELECQIDPVAFKSALEAAREDRKTVVNNATAVRSFITTTIKDDLAKAQASIVENNIKNKAKTTDPDTPTSSPQSTEKTNTETQ